MYKKGHGNTQWTLAKASEVQCGGERGIRTFRKIDLLLFQWVNFYLISVTNKERDIVSI